MDKVTIYNVKEDIHDDEPTESRLIVKLHTHLSALRIRR